MSHGSGFKGWGLALLLAAASLSGCGSPQQAGNNTTRALVPVPPLGGWTADAKEHVDVWLHSYALIYDDTTLVPFFKRGYRAQMGQVKGRANALTLLDANRDRLASGLRTNPALVSGQFLPLYFDSWPQMNSAIDLYLRAGGNPRAGNTDEERQAVNIVASLFPRPADRDWLQLFSNAVRDEYTKFYHSYWIDQQRSHDAVRARVDSLWNSAYYPKFRHYLNSTSQGVGRFLVSLPLDGEGRTVQGGRFTNTITVELADAPENAIDALYVFAHEATGPITAPAIKDNTTPAEQRAGIADRYSSAAAVQSGAMLIKRLAPELLDGYVRFYLTEANRPAPAAGTDPLAALQAVFPLPQPIRDAMSKQIDVAAGGV